jgi:hydrogenase maturation protease
VTSICVVGCGNPFRGDDAVGLAVARAVASRMPAGLDVFELADEPTRLLDIWAGYDLAFVVDMVRSGAPPGTVHWLDVTDRDPPVDLVHGSSHQVGLADVVALARVLDRLPSRLVLVGVEGSQVDTGRQLTGDVRRVVGAVVDRLVRETNVAT